MTEYCYLAFVNDPERGEDYEVVKIGRSKNPARRFDELCSVAWMAPHKMVVAEVKNSVEIEADLHEQLRKHRIKNEWFWVPSDDLWEAVNNVEVENGIEFTSEVTESGWR